METKQFKTNIKCSGCIATVTPFLNEVAGENAWSVDTAAPDKVLTISAEKVTSEEIVKAIEKAGYKAEKL